MSLMTLTKIIIAGVEVDYRRQHASSNEPALVIAHVMGASTSVYLTPNEASRLAAALVNAAAGADER